MTDLGTSEGGIATSLYDLATALLAAVDTGFANYGVALPSMQYVTGVQPVAACDSVAVSWTAVNSGWPGQPTGPTPFNLASTTTAILTVSIFRCLSAVIGAQGQGPTTAQLQADARTIMTDAFVLFRTLMKATKQQPAWFGNYATAMQLGPLGVVPADGGEAGVIMDVWVELT